MPEQDDRDADDMDARFLAALSAQVPSVYFNGFITKLSVGDITVTLERNGTPAGVLNMSYTVAKSLAFSLSQVIAQLEEITGRDMLTTGEISKMVAQQEERRPGGDDK